MGVMVFFKAVAPPQSVLLLLLLLTHREKLQYQQAHIDIFSLLLVSTICMCQLALPAPQWKYWEQGLMEILLLVLIPH
jgi:hypothetical protein